MAFLDIEQSINRENIASRFKLVHLASLRAKELNNPAENTVMPELKPGQKVTSKALAELVNDKIDFEEINEEND